MAAVALTYALLIAAIVLDARTLRHRSPELYASTTAAGPVGWGVLALLFSVIAGFAYLARRKECIARIEKLDSGELEETPGLLEPPTDLPSNHAAPPPLNDTPHFKTIIGATGVLIAGVSVSVTLSFVYGLVAGALGGDGIGLVGLSVVTLLGKVIYVGLIYDLATRRYEGGFRKLVSLDGVQFEAVRDLFAPIAIGAVMAYAVYLVGVTRTSVPVTPIGTSLANSNAAGLVVYTIVAILTAPVLEELIFRGFFYRAIERIRGPQFAVISIAAAFWLAHVGQLWGDPITIAAMIPVALVLTGYRWYAGWIVPGIVVHFVYNAAMIVIPVIALFASGPWGEYSQATNAPPAEQELLLRQLVAEHPDYDPALNALAWFYAEEGRNLEDALNLVDRALANDPLNDAYLDTRAEVLYQMGRVAEAIEIERRLVSEHPDVPFYREQLQKFEAALE